MVDVSVSTEARRTCNVATITEDVSLAGESDSYQAAPPAIYNEENAHGIPSEQYAEWCTIYGPQADHFAEWCEWYANRAFSQWNYGAPVPEWCGTFEYTTPPAYDPEWSYVAPSLRRPFLFSSQTALFRATNLS